MRIPVSLVIQTALVGGYIAFILGIVVWSIATGNHNLW